MDNARWNMEHFWNECNGDKKSYNKWTKKVMSFCESKQPGFGKALSWCEKSQTPIGATELASTR